MNEIPIENKNEDEEFEEDMVISDDPKMVQALCTGILKLGTYEIPCFVLKNKKRVLTQREVVFLLTGNRKGGLDRYTKAPNLQEFMPQKYVEYQHKEVTWKLQVRNMIAYCYEATDVIDICDGYLKARQAGKLHPTQEHLAIQAEVIIRACAKIGIEALIDEATGYDKIKESDERQTKFAAYIAEDLREWTKTFPSEFFEQLYRLEGKEHDPTMRTYPKRFGKYVMQFVYDTMDKDISDWLRENNPNPSWNKHHHQWLTEEFGYPKLLRHLMSVLGIMKASLDMINFKDNLYRAFPDGKRTTKHRAIEAKKDDRQIDLFTWIG